MEIKIKNQNKKKEGLLGKGPDKQPVVWRDSVYRRGTIKVRVPFDVAMIYRVRYCSLE